MNDHQAMVSRLESRSPYVKLVSRDGAEFVLQRQAAYQSRVIREHFEANTQPPTDPALDELFLPNGVDAPVVQSTTPAYTSTDGPGAEVPELRLDLIDSKVLDLVCQYLTERYVNSHYMLEFPPLNSLNPQNDKDRKLALDVLLAADFLDC